MKQMRRQISTGVLPFAPCSSQNLDSLQTNPHLTAGNHPLVRLRARVQRLPYRKETPSRLVSIDLLIPQARRNRPATTALVHAPGATPRQRTASRRVCRPGNPYGTSGILAHCPCLQCREIDDETHAHLPRMGMPGVGRARRGKCLPGPLRACVLWHLTPEVLIDAQR